jgi:hypothetical protein
MRLSVASVEMTIPSLALSRRFLLCGDDSFFVATIPSLWRRFLLCGDDSFFDEWFDGEFWSVDG